MKFVIKNDEEKKEIELSLVVREENQVDVIATNGKGKEMYLVGFKNGTMFRHSHVAMDGIEVNGIGQINLSNRH